MNSHIAYAKFLLVGLLFSTILAACASANDPTPEAPLAEVVTVFVERPSASSTPQPRNTPTLIPILVETETAVSTSTPQPTTTAIVTPYLKISRPILSDQGQLAFIRNQTLFVETAVGTQNFLEVASFVNNGAWSNDGERIAFYISNMPNAVDNKNVALWDQQVNSVTYLSDLVSNFPPIFPDWENGEFRLNAVKWSPSDNKILFTVWNSAGSGVSGVWIADLVEKRFNLEINAFKTNRAWWLDEENILLNWHCGAPCEGLAAYKNGEISWELPSPTPGLFALSAENEFLVSLGRDPDDGSFTMREINLITGKIKTIWEPEMDDYLPLLLPQISPNDQFISFHFGGDNPLVFNDLYIIDRNGRSYGQRPNSFIVDWRPGGGSVVEEWMADGQIQLVYWPLDGAAARVFVSPKPFDFKEGKWSPDGRFFIYNAVDKAENKSYVYLWQPESGASTLIHAANSDDGFRNFAWLPDSSGVYFNLGREELWKFDAETAVLTLIASSDEN